MAEKLCTLRGAGGGGAKQTETVLWTNSSPTSNFADQNVTLSDSMSNYDYLKFTYKKATNNATSTSAIFSVSDVKNFADESVYGQIGGESATDWYMSRMLWYVSDTSVKISTAWGLNRANSANNSYIIPLSIIGIKNIGGTSIKSQFKEIFICSSPGSSLDALASRGYELENAQSGDTLTGEAYNLTYLTATYTSGSTGYCQVTAKSDITAMVIKGYNTATYTVQNYTTGQLVGQCNRKSGDFLLIGIL